MWTVNRTLKALCLMMVWGSLISIGACGGRTLGGHLVEEECNDGVDNDGDGDTDCDDEDCAQDPVCESLCGDGVVTGAEACDGSDLQMKDCKSFGYDGGTLLCSNGCFFDTSECTLNPLCGNGALDSPG